MTAPSRSEHRLHPVALFLFIGGQLKELGFAIGAWLVASWLGDADAGMLGPLIGGVVVGVVVFVPSLTRLLTFRYAYGAGELILRWGLLFRHERHVPYQRIQNLDARETLLHRATGTVKVVIETGGGRGEAEASIEAVPWAAFEAMRSRILVQPAAPEATAPDPGTTLVALGPRELVLAGLVLNRGMIVVGGLVALAAELGFGDRLLQGWLGEDLAGQGTTRTLMELLSGARTLAPGDVLQGLAALLLFVVMVRVFSMVLTVIRYHDHRLMLVEDDLRVGYGLLTRVNSTTPRRRIQTVSIREGPWHRLVRRVTIQAVTAGGSVEGAAASRETLAPLVRREAVDALVPVILPGALAGEAEWRRAAAPALRRAVWRTLGWWTPLLAVAAWVGVPALVLASGLASLSLVAAIGRVRHFAWREGDDLLVVRAGWLWRRTTFVRHDRIQGVVSGRSPFDRRHGMQRVEVDTAGLSASALELPHLWRDEAQALADHLAAGAARTAFRL